MPARSALTLYLSCLGRNIKSRQIFRDAITNVLCMNGTPLTPETGLHFPSDLHYKASDYI